MAYNSNSDGPKDPGRRYFIKGASAAVIGTCLGLKTKNLYADGSTSDLQLLEQYKNMNTLLKKLKKEKFDFEVDVNGNKVPDEVKIRKVDKAYHDNLLWKGDIIEVAFNLDGQKDSPTSYMSVWLEGAEEVLGSDEKLIELGTGEKVMGYVTQSTEYKMLKYGVEVNKALLEEIKKKKKK